MLSFNQRKQGDKNMNYSNYPFTLDIHSAVSQISFPVSLNDTARSLTISLTDGGRPYEIADGCRAVLAGVKPDGTRLLNDCIIVGNKIIRYDFTPQTASVVGKADCEIRLYGVDGNLVTSPRFTIVVYEGLLDEGILSKDEKTTINNMLVAEQLRIAAENERIAAEAEREEIAKRAEAAADRVKESLNGDRVYIRYSAYPDGEGYVSEWSRGLNYIGVAAGLDEPSDKSGYEWSVFAPGIYVGSGDMPDYADIQIDPDSEDVDLSTPLKGFATGSTVCFDDVSSVPHNVLVKVLSNNLIPYPFTETTKTEDGVTFTDNGDGTVTLTGTHGGNSPAFTLGTITIKESGNYYLSGCPEGGGNSSYALVAWGGSTGNVMDVGAGKGFYANAGEVFEVTVNVTGAPVGATFNVTFKPQLEVGESARGASVVASGKNLLDESAERGKVGVYTGIDITHIAEFFGRNLWLSLKLKEGKSVPQVYFGYAYTLENANPTANWVLTPTGGVVEKGLKIPAWYDKVGVCAYGNSNIGINGPQAFELVLDSFDVQLEVGATKTEYMPFSFYEEYTADENGEVDIPSRSPYMMIASKNAWHILSATCNRDLDMAIAQIDEKVAELSRITNALLGG
jgi:hypothetical protein